MTTKSFPLYAEQLNAILNMTEILNSAGNAIDFGDQYHLKVQLVSSVDEKVIGEWSDEVDSTDWEFAIVHEEEKPKFNPHVMRIDPNNQGMTPRGFTPAQTQITPEEMLRTNGVIHPEVRVDTRPMPVEKPITGHSDY